MFQQVRLVSLDGVIRTFEKILSYRIAYPRCCRLANPDTAEETLFSSRVVDELTTYTLDMWGLLTAEILWEWFGIRLPKRKVPWDGPVYLPPGHQLLYRFNRKDARALRHDVQRRYFEASHHPDRVSIFAGYGVNIPGDMQREREGFEFLARQTEHFDSDNQYVFVVCKCSTFVMD